MHGNRGIKPFLMWLNYLYLSINNSSQVNNMPRKNNLKTIEYVKIKKIGAILWSMNDMNIFTIIFNVDQRFENRI